LVDETLIEIKIHRLQLVTVGSRKPSSQLNPLWIMGNRTVAEKGG